MARRRARKISWSAAKVTLVAIKRVGVGPGVKMLDHRSSMKEAMIFKKMKFGKSEGLQRGGVGNWNP